MAVNDLNTAVAQIRKATKQLEDAWQETRQYWNDPVSEQFQRTHLDPILPKLRIAFSSLQELAEITKAGENACRDSERGDGGQYGGHNG